MALILTDKCIKDWMMILRPEDGKSVKTWSLYKHIISIIRGLWSNYFQLN